MSKYRPDAEQPVVALSLELDGALARLVDNSDPLHAAARQAIEQGLTSLMQVLGVPGAATIDISTLNPTASTTSRWLRLRVGNELCRYDDDILRLVQSYVLEQHPDPRQDLASILNWLSRALDHEDAEAGRDDQVVDFLRLTCLEIITMQPGRLMEFHQAAVYLKELPLRNHGAAESTPPIAPEWLLPVLRKVLNLRISLADLAAVAVVLEGAQGRSQEDLVEDLIAALRPDIIELRFSEHYLKQLTSGGERSANTPFTTLREDLFQELGAIYPPFHFVLDEGLKPNSFAFTINHLSTLPMQGLQIDQGFIDRTAERPALGRIPEPTLVYHTYEDMKGQLGYVARYLTNTLRASGACFVDQRWTQQQLDQLSKAFPAVVRAAASRISIQQLTHILRALVAERVSIRNLRLILERLLDYAYHDAIPAKYMVLDDRPFPEDRSDASPSTPPESLVAFVRAGLRRQITYQYSQGMSSLEVFLLAPDIEASLLLHSREMLAADYPSLSEDQSDMILAAIRSALAQLPAITPLPPILTSTAVRPLLRDLIALEFPTLPVVAYLELTDEVSVQTITTIARR